MLSMAFIIMFWIILIMGLLSTMLNTWFKLMDGFSAFV